VPRIRRTMREKKMIEGEPRRDLEGGRRDTSDKLAL